MLDANPDLSPAQVKEILSRTATPLSKYFFHEAGAGMLNTHAAVLEAAFPEREMGAFRSTLSRNSIRFITRTSQLFTQTVFPGAAAYTDVAIPANTVQATINVSWPTSANDLGLKVLNSSNALVGESNQVNIAGLTGLREKVQLRNPAAQTLRSSVRHTAGIGTAQNVFGLVEVTQVEYPALLDIGSIPQDLIGHAQTSLITNVLLPEGRKFRPDGAVTRGEFAGSIVRAGLVPQYMAGSAMFPDVRDAYSRNLVESAQANPAGKIFFDANAGTRFYPHNSTSRLVAAVAFVRAAKLEHLAATTTLPLTVTDASSIPVNLRGYVAVALDRGYISLN
jgi:serine protease AprX